MRRPEKTGSMQKHAPKALQSEINCVVHSLEDNGFMLAASKTVFLAIISKRKKNPPYLVVNIKGTPLMPSSSVKYLCFTFQRNGLMTGQVKQAIANARRALNLMHHVVLHESCGQKIETPVHLTLSLVRSRLPFSSPAMYNMPLSSAKELAAVECTALRLARGFPGRVPQRQVYNEAGVLPIWRCICRSSCNYLFRAARVPNSTDEELEEKLNQTLLTNQNHGLVTAIHPESA